MVRTTVSDMSCQEQRIITVVQGDYHISNDPRVMMSTILGSCVAVCIFDAKAGIGGMNHFLLPNDDGDSLKNVKYGTYAMEILINQLIKAGAHKSELQAKLFGGGCMTTNMVDIGASNVAFGQKFLADEGVPCISESVGGTQARRVQFTPATGAVRQRLVSGNQLDQALRTPNFPPCDITLF